MIKDQIITVQDLLDLEARLRQSLDELKKGKESPFPQHVKGSALRKLLGGISEGKLQQMRTQGLPFVKIQGLILFPLEEVLEYLDSLKSNKL
jgi:hypothetical protein